jgi:hypothetical protein
VRVEYKKKLGLEREIEREREKVFGKRQTFNFTTTHTHTLSLLFTNSIKQVSSDVSAATSCLCNLTLVMVYVMFLY